MIGELWDEGMRELIDEIEDESDPLDDELGDESEGGDDFETWQAIRRYLPVGVEIGE